MKFACGLPGGGGYNCGRTDQDATRGQMSPIRHTDLGRFFRGGKPVVLFYNRPAELGRLRDNRVDGSSWLRAALGTARSCDDPPDPAMWSFRACLSARRGVLSGERRALK